jgi:hypothetical protein
MLHNCFNLLQLLSMIGERSDERLGEWSGERLRERFGERLRERFGERLGRGQVRCWVRV